MLLKIKNKIRFALLKLAIRPFSEARGIKVFENLDSEIEHNKKRLQPYYEDYVRDISSADMAASLELVAFMFSICEINQYKKVLDMGSGLSSFVLRLYARENPGVKIFSVDDDSVWLERTKRFLSDHQLDTDNVYTLDQFLKAGEADFDCILHDLNFVEVRIEYTEKLMKMIKQHGLIIFDDVHKPDYLFALLVKLKSFKHSIYNLKPVTTDSYGRFALCLIKR